MTKDAGPVAEAWFDRYLNEMGYDYIVEEETPAGRHPDRKVIASGRTVVCEVKSFAAEGIFRDLQFGPPDLDGVRHSGVLVRDMKKALAPVREQIKEAASQLKGFSDRGWPLMVVLANPQNRPVPLTVPEVMAAMYGDLSLQVELNEGEHAASSWVAGRNGRLRNNHLYISAVAVLRYRQVAQDVIEATTEEEFAAIRGGETPLPPGDYVCMDVIETASKEAPPLPRDVFNGPRDRRYGPTSDRTRLIEVSLIRS